MYNGESEKINKSDVFGYDSDRNSHSVSDFEEISSKKRRESLQENEEDDQIARIVQKVMRNSRRTYLQNSFGDKEKDSSNYASKNNSNILEVNCRIEDENSQLRKQIEKLEKKLSKMNKKSVNNSQTTSFMGKSSLNGRKQLQKLKQRLQRAEEIHEKMENQLKFLQKSRKSQIRKHKKSKESLNTCSKCNNSKSKDTERQIKPTLKEEPLYSPIAQFQQYNIPFASTSTFRINSCADSSDMKMLKSIFTKNTMSVQADQQKKQLEDQATILDTEIEALESKILLNNRKIDKYEGKLLKGVVKQK